MLDIKIKPTHDNFKHPVKGSEHAACWDVYAADIKKTDYDLYEIDLGFATEIPVGYKGRITPRSSITKHRLIMGNSPATIDSDYRGNWKIKFRFLPSLFDQEFPYEIGDRVAQVYFEKEVGFQWDLVNILSDTDRGSGGFGSSGIK